MEYHQCAEGTHLILELTYFRLKCLIQKPKHQLEGIRDLSQAVLLGQVDTDGREWILRLKLLVFQPGPGRFLQPIWVIWIIDVGEVPLGQMEAYGCLDGCVHGRTGVVVKLPLSARWD